MELKSLQSLRTLRAGAVPVALLTGLMAACSGSGPQRDSQQNAPAAPAESTPAAREAVQSTPADAGESLPAGQAMTESSAATQPSDTRAAISPTAPKSYTVQRGDTLWDIANAFLRDPWYWPEIWYVNPQVENPHLIYPGDVLTLAYGADGQPQIRLERGSADRLSPRMRSQPLDGPINTIPYEIVAAFMSKPMVLEKDQIKAAPYIVSSRDQHIVMATGNTLYARGNLAGDVNTRYSIVHVGEELRDPDDNDVVGFEGHYAGSARLTRTGDPASLIVTESQRETFEGDKLFPTEIDVPLDFIPRAPAGQLDGRIISVVNGISVVGQYQVVVINRGKRHGLEPGHVLTIQQAGPVVRDRHAGGMSRVSSPFGEKVRLPDEPAGTFMVFKTFDRISYGLIMEAQAAIRVMDRVVSP